MTDLILMYVSLRGGEEKHYFLEPKSRFPDNFFEGEENVAITQNNLIDMLGKCWCPHNCWNDIEIMRHL